MKPNKFIPSTNCPCETGGCIAAFVPSFTVGPGGTVTDNGGGSFTIDGDVDINGINAEAYQIDLVLDSGSFELTIGGDTVGASADDQTITANALTARTGFTSRVGYDLELNVVHIRATPDFIAIYALGNYGEACLTIDRNGTDPPTTITGSWDSAEVAVISLQSSEVIGTGDEISGYTITQDCWSPPIQTYTASSNNYNYEIAKRVSQDHAYIDDPNHLEDLWIAEAEITGVDFFPFTPSGGWAAPGQRPHASGYIGGGQGWNNTYEWRRMPTPQHISSISGGSLIGSCGASRLRNADFAGPYDYYPSFARWNVEVPGTNCSGSTLLDWYAGQNWPSVVTNLYPKPKYVQTLSIIAQIFAACTSQFAYYEASGTAIHYHDVNDVLSEITGSVTAEFSYQSKDPGCFDPPASPPDDDVTLEWSL
ncbi:hypothetical protein [Roseiconus lacunae]|uniref:Uncharacterized protein n=1 Tax=Roseiconus lacunae TaxID=2605694 RepID=A0ABT7PHZ1_9BACT|nr:hypothetical protein [Roseiconus lacunae]MDM4015866.1 hypothetical protein [Roseiconus lacunae]